MSGNTTWKEKAAEAAFVNGFKGVMGAYRAAEPHLRRRVEANLVNKYDDKTATFEGGEMETLTQRNYEKAFVNLWKAETVAPYLGFHDASKADKAAAVKDRVVVGAYHGDGAICDDDPTVEIEDLVAHVTSEEVRREFQEAYSPAEREAICMIMSLLGHGEAYALYTSATLLPVVKGTGAKMGMAMQAMEEAKHFMVLREMLRTIDDIRPLHTSARMLFERVAGKDYYHKLFGMNVILESFATNLFSHFEDFPGLRHIMRAFHMDESRHCAFPQTYASLGNIPDHVTNDPKYQRARLLMLAPALPIIFDYKPYFETLGLDVFQFFGRFVAKVTRLSERSGFPMPQKREDILYGLNNLFNAYVRNFEPEKYEGYRDYTLLKDGEISKDMADREREVFGADIFGGLGDMIAKMRLSRNAARSARSAQRTVASMLN